MASSSSVHKFFDDLNEKVLECPLCLNRFKDPKTLACLHAFCLSCLQDWVNKKGELVCPTCIQSFAIPDGGLHKLPPNTFINDLLESIGKLEIVDNADKIKCYCGKNTADFYCQECMQYICTACKQTHETLPALLQHKLNAIDDVQLIPRTEPYSLQPPICPAHKKFLKYYCKVCETPICVTCIVTDHNAKNGKHPVIYISQAFTEFKCNALKLEENVVTLTQTIQAALTEIHHRATILDQNRETCKRDVNKYVEDMVQMIIENGETLNRHVDEIYEKKKRRSDRQIDGLNAIILNASTTWNIISQLLKSSEAAAMQTGPEAMASLQKIFQQLPDTKPKDDGEMHLYLRKQHCTNGLEQEGFGFIIETSHAKCLEIANAPKVLTQGQTFEVEILNSITPEIQLEDNLLKATLTSSGEDTTLEIVRNGEGKYVVSGVCSSSTGVCKLNVSLGGEPIRGSPVIITVEEQGLVKTIERSGMEPTDVLMSKDGCLLVACSTNEIHKFKQSGEYVSKITLPSKVCVFSMYKMKNKNVMVYSDIGDKCIVLCKLDGQVIKAIGEGVLNGPSGIDVDENLNVVYVTDWDEHCVFMFDMNSGEMIRRIGSQGQNISQLQNPEYVTITNGGHLVIVDSDNHRLQLFDNRGNFIKILVGKGDQDGKVTCPKAVVIDKDGNMIVTSFDKLQLFNNDGQFIKRIDKEGELSGPEGLTIVSENPRRVAVANQFGRNVRIFNY